MKQPEPAAADAGSEPAPPRAEPGSGDEEDLPF